MRAALIVLILALTIYSLLDCARTPEESMPARMPKLLWVALIAVITPIGPIAWIIVSRVKAAEERGRRADGVVLEGRHEIPSGGAAASRGPRRRSGVPAGP